MSDVMDAVDVSDDVRGVSEIPLEASESYSTEADVREGEESGEEEGQEEEDIESYPWWKRWASKAFRAMEIGGAVVSGILGIEDSVFQDVIDDMDPEDYARAMEVKRVREEQDAIYDAQLAAEAAEAEAKVEAELARNGGVLADSSATLAPAGGVEMTMPAADQV
jgi:hypothetical protein